MSLNNLELEITEVSCSQLQAFFTLDSLWIHPHSIFVQLITGLPVLVSDCCKPVNSAKDCKKYLEQLLFAGKARPRFAM